MFLIIVAGLITASSIRKETNPEFVLDQIEVRVAYLGAAPQEVEEGVVLKIEEAIQDQQGIKTIRSRATEGMGSISIEVEPGWDIAEVMSDAKTAHRCNIDLPGAH